MHVESSTLDARADALEHIPESFDQCSHVANGIRISKHFGDQLLFVQGIGWHVFSPPWRHDELGARKLCQKLGRIIADEAAALGPWVASAGSKEDRDKRQTTMDRLFKWAGASESAPCIEHSLQMAAPLLACKAGELDANPMLLGMPNGVLDLETGRSRAHGQLDRITKTTAVDYDPDANAPTWERFLSEIITDPEVIEFLQRVCGYTLSGLRNEHILLILWGGGANGKSTFIGVLQKMLKDYASGAAPGLLIQRHGTDHPTGLADLQGRRLVVVSETGEAGRLNEEVVKALTGGDQITARRMRMDFYTFNPSHLLVLQTNHLPKVNGTDEGIWRRVRPVPFTVTIPPEDRDPTLPEKLVAALPGILAWCVKGWQKYRAHGLSHPAAVRAATAAYRDASDQLGAFLAEWCVIADGFTTAASELYAAYCQWCEEAGERQRSKRDFGIALSERGYEQTRTGKARRWRGLRIASDASDVSDAGFGLSTTRDTAHGAHTEKRG